MTKKFFIKFNFKAVSRIVTALIILLSFCALAFPSQKQEKIIEKVTVTNVEVPVRVLHKGKPVADLRKEDFILYESNKKVIINAFVKKSKKISLKKQAEKEQTFPRTFVLVFNVTDYNKEFSRALDHLFDNILRSSDQLLVFANDRTREFSNLNQKTKIKQRLMNDLKEESQKNKRRLTEYINRIETYLRVDNFKENLLRGRFREGEGARKLLNFLKKYQITWNEYKNRYLTPKVDRFYYFSRFLEKVKGEKWVLNFYQFELFPRIRLGSQTMFKIRDISNELTNTDNPTMVATGRMIDVVLNQLNTDLLLDKGFNNEEVTKLFFKVNATFHSFFIKTISALLHNDLEYNEVSSDIERVLKGITDLTGGKNITNNNLVNSLNEVSEIEDVYYILTYTPKNPDITEKIKIKVKGKKYQVLYDDNFRADYISEYLEKLEQKIQTPDIIIDNFSFKRKILAFIIKNYLQKQTAKGEAGQIKVRIRLKDEKNNSLFDQAKVFTAQKNEMKISLGAFQKIKKGNYIFLIDVTDMYTGKEANFYQDITVK